ncbi:MAG TPA: hypothetical protein VN371_08235 [Chlorobaculum sp.]|nr:hypothetical protein [Chlorobaculum sp.]
MAEQIVTGYKKLFEVRLLHHYWLDDGKTVFDRVPGDRKELFFQTYDIGGFLSIAPTDATDKLMRVYGGLFRTTPTGFIAAVPGDTILPSDTVFDFILKVRSAGFFNYTAMTLRPQTVRELYSEPEKTRFRFKENVPVFSNLTGASRGTGSDKTLFLSREIPALKPTDTVESLIVKSGALYQLTADSTGSGVPAMQKLDDDTSLLPAFASQEDVPVIVAPEGVSGAPARGISLTGDIPDDVFALVRICAVRVGDDDFSFTDGGGLPKTTSPVFHLRFKNRQTWWKRIDRNRLETISAEPLPLTFFGNASGTGLKPSAGLVKAEKDALDHITRLVSEIIA